MLEITLSIIVILLSARLFAKLMSMLGLPKVLGEMISGLLLGPSCLGFFFPGLMQELFTTDVKQFLSFLSSIGLSIYMFLVGMEMGGLNKRSLQEGSKIASVGFIAPFLLGLISSTYLYSVIPITQPFIVFSIFIAIAMSITSIPMLARMLEERKLNNSRLGRLTIMSASVDDLIVWCLLTFAIAITTSAGIAEGAVKLALSVVFLATVFFVVRPLVSRLISKVAVRDGGELKEGMMSTIIISILCVALVSESIGITSLIGCFLLGTVMPDVPALKKEIDKAFHGITTTFFIPIYFVLAGLQANILQLFEQHSFLALIIVIIASFTGKYLGCTLTMKKMGYSWGESSALGGLMNAKGLMGLLIAGIGLQYGFIPQSVYSMLALTSIVTTALAIPIFNMSMNRSRVVPDKSLKDGVNMGNG